MAVSSTGIATRVVDRTLPNFGMQPTAAGAAAADAGR